VIGVDGKAVGWFLQELTWLEAESLLTPERLVLIPLGAAAKEHGPHLLLKNDELIANYLARRLVELAPIVVAPTINYSYYPAFAEYPGSISLSSQTAANMVIEICRSLAAFGPRYFYVLNTGISTVKPLDAAKQALQADGVHLEYTNLAVLKELEDRICEQEGGTHADENETSMMLYIAPETVDMSKAVKDFDAKGTGALSRSKGTGTYSPSGIFGDATLATLEKGQQIVEFLVEHIANDLESLQRILIKNPDG
jgi:creatinine amidohydrolase